MTLQKQIEELKKINKELNNEHLEKTKFHKKELSLIISHYYVLMSDNETFSDNEIKEIKEKTAFRVENIIEYVNFLQDINNKSLELIEILNNKGQKIEKKA